MLNSRYLTINSELIRERILFAAILVTPFLYLPVVSDPAHSPVYFWFCFVLSLLSILIGKQTSEFSIDRKLFSILMVWLGVALVSLILTAYNSEATLEFSRLTFFIITNLFFSNFIPKSKKWNSVFIFLGIIYMYYGYSDFFKFYNSEDIYHGLYAIRAHIGHKNLLSIYLALTFPFAYYYFKSENQVWVKIGLLLYTAMSAGLVFLVQSRVGLLGLLIFIGLTILYELRYKNITAKGFLAVIIPFIVCVHWVGNKTAFYKERFQRLEKVFVLENERDKDNQSVLERLELWKASKGLFGENPFQGCGLGQWKLRVPAYDLSKTRTKFGNIIFQQPHNDFVWVFCEYGLIGGLCFIGLFGYSFYVLYRKGIWNPENYLYLSFLLIYFCASMFDFPKERPIFLLFFGFVLVNVHRDGTLYLFRIPRVWLTFTLLILTLFFAKRVLSEDVIHRLIYYRMNRKNDKTVELANQAKDLGVDYDVTSTPLDYYIGESYYNESRWDSAVVFFKKSISASPYHLYSWNHLGLSYNRLGNDLKAIYCWEKAKQISRDFADPRIQLAYYYMRRGDYSSVEENLHFVYERDQMMTFETSLSFLMDTVLSQYQQTSTSSMYKEEIDSIKKINQRKFWLLGSFGSDTISFKEKMDNDIFYNVVYNRKILDSREAKKRLFNL